jgi:HipA-like protein
MRTLAIYRNGTLAGLLIEENRKHYIFTYDDKYFMNENCADISLTLPKSQKEYDSECLFPFFFNMLSEGINRQLQSKQLKIDEEDDFGLLGATAQNDTIGAITVKPIL